MVYLHIKIFNNIYYIIVYLTIKSTNNRNQLKIGLLKKSIVYEQFSLFL